MSIDDVPSEPALKFAPVVCLFRCLDGVVYKISTDRRVLIAGQHVVRHNGRIFLYTATNQTVEHGWARTYLEAKEVRL